jgi:transposase
VQTPRVPSHARPGCRHRRRIGRAGAGAGETALLADKGYDGDDLRADIAERGATPVIPNKSNRKTPHPFDPNAYKGRNVIERSFSRLKDFRRIATRYDKLARNFLAVVLIAALVAYWLN